MTTTGPYRYAHLKLDGHCITLEHDTAWTKTMIDIRSKLEFLNLPPVPRGVSLHGELWAPGVRASSIKTLIINKDERLRFTVWGVTGLPRDEAIPFPSPDESLEVTERIVTETYGFEYAPWWYYDSRPETLPEHAEGWVFKNSNWGHSEKWKPVLTIDAVVLGIVPGKNKYTGQTGALVVGIGDRVLANVSGMTDAERRDMGPHDIGRVVEVAYQYVGDGGRLRHPRFIRFRDDKLAAQCTLSQDPALTKGEDQ